MTTKKKTSTKSVKKKISTSSKIPKKTIVKKKAVKQVKSVSKSKPIKKQKSGELSKEDSKLLNESLEIIQKLNSEIDKVRQTKTKLEKEVSTLGDRVKATSKSHEKNIKDSIKKEITPVIDSFNLNSIKDEIYKEINKLLELEFEKVKSQVDSKSNQTKRDLTKKISDIESQLLISIKANNKIKEELKKTPHLEELYAQLESKIKTSITSANKKSHNLFVSTQNDLEELKSQIQEHKKENTLIKTAFTKLQNLVSQSKSDKSVDFSAIESKLSNLQKENTSIKKLIEKYENDLYSRKSDELKEIENKIKSSLNEERLKTKEIMSVSQKELNEIKKDILSKLNSVEKDNAKLNSTIEQYKAEIIAKEKEGVTKIEAKVNEELIAAKETLKGLQTAKRGQAEFLVDKINEIVDNVNSFEEEIKQLDKKSIAEIDRHSKEKAKEVKEELKKALREELKILREDNEKDLRKVVSKLESKEQVADKSLLKFKDNILSSIEKQVKDVESGFEKIKEEVAKEILKANEFKTKAINEIKDDKQKLSIDIENKLVTSKNQYEESFNNHLKKFDEELKTKESQYLAKLLAVEDEKNHMISELSDFKVEIAKLTKDYVSKLDSEFEKIKAEESSFKDQKNNFLGEITDLTNARKLELEDYTQNLKSTISQVLEDEKTQFERHEETFREVFNEKIQNLTDFNKRRLEQIEKKFVDKNLKYVQSRIDEGMKEITILEDSIKAKANETLLRVESLEKKENTLAQDLQSELDVMREKIEERLTSEQKSLNKRFLELDSDFTNFKGIVIDEVEDLIKEVNTVVDSKIQLIDTGVAKMNFAGNEIAKRINQYDSTQKVLENHVRDLRDEISDIRVKVDVGLPQLDSMNSLVQMMGEYEQGLINLIKSLKNRGVADDAIKTALLKKGHPMFYVSIVLNNFDQIKN